MKAVNYIKLIWDFRGEDAQKIAEHHVIHLKEFIKREEIAHTEAGCSDLMSLHSIAYVITPKSNMIKLRDALRPNRGEVYEP